LSEETALIIAEETWAYHGKVCPKLSEETALIIAVCKLQDVISLSKLVKKYDAPDEIAEIIKTLAKYGDS